MREPGSCDILVVEEKLFVFDALAEQVGVDGVRETQQGTLNLYAIVFRPLSDFEWVVKI